MKRAPRTWTGQQGSLRWQADGGTVAGYAHLAADRWRGSGRATPLAPMLDINHIPMEILQFLQHVRGRNCQTLLDVHVHFV